MAHLIQMLDFNVLLSTQFLAYYSDSDTCTRHCSCEALTFTLWVNINLDRIHHTLWLVFYIWDRSIIESMDHLPILVYSHTCTMPCCSNQTAPVAYFDKCTTKGLVWAEIISLFMQGIWSGNFYIIQWTANSILSYVACQRPLVIFWYLHPLLGNFLQHAYFESESLHFSCNDVCFYPMAGWSSFYLQ